MVERLFQSLEQVYGDLGWWPAHGAFEVAVGAVLTQNTAWRNVERAIDGLRERHWLEPEALVGAPSDDLAVAIRPSGYYNVKAGRLRALCHAWLDAGGEAGLAAKPTPALREYLLGIHGVGRETADDILLYAFQRPVFVVDAYTERILTRFGWLEDRPGYEALRSRLEAVLAASAPAYQRYHAQIVALGKDYCRPRPRCPSCPVAGICARRGVTG